jgi:hypothetical protein
MKTYVSILKILGVILLIPIGMALVLILGFIGFGLDFNNAWSDNSDSAGSMYMLFLPLGFLGLVGWAIYALSRRLSAGKCSSQERMMPQSEHREQNLNANTYDLVLDTLSKNGGKTSLEISQILMISEEETLKVIGELLQSGRIRQDSTQQPARFFAI